MGTRLHLGATTSPQPVVLTRLIVQVPVTLLLIGATLFQLRAVHTLLIVSMRASVWLNGVTVFQLLIELSIRHVLGQELQLFRLKSRSWFAVWFHFSFVLLWALFLDVNNVLRGILL